MKQKHLITLCLMLAAWNTHAEFEARIEPDNLVIIPVHNTKGELNYSISDGLSSSINIQFRGRCDKGWLTKFGLELGGVNYTFPGISGENKSISGNNGDSWATHTMSGQQVLPENNVSLINACNQRSKEAFSQSSSTILQFDRIALNVETIPLKVRYTCKKRVGFSDPPRAHVVDNLELGVRCMASNYVAPIEEIPILVSDVEFRIDKQVSLGGLCKVSLKGALNTSKPSQSVRFRYEHIDHSFNKKLSQIHQVTTDQQGYANFAHEYPVPNGPGKEKGRMKVLGVSHEFQSEQLNYSMNCKDGGPGDLQEAGKSTVKLEAKAIKSSNQPFGNQICPTKLKFTGIIKAGNDLSGKAVFVGQSILDIQSKNFSVKKGKTKRVTRTIDLKWTAPSMTTLATGNGISTPLMTQNIMQSFNIVGDNSQTVILSVPRKSFSVSCSTGNVQSGLQTQNGGFTTFPSHTGGGAPTDLQINQQSVTPILPAKPKPVKNVKRKIQKQKKNKK